MAMTSQTGNDASWSAGDGYQVIPQEDYLSGLQEYKLQNNYFGGNGGTTGGDNTGNSTSLTGSYAPFLSSSFPSSPNFTSAGAGLGLGGTAGAIAGGAGALIGAYEGASTDTGSSVLSGAAEGAIAGTQIFPGWGTAIGAVVGGLAGLFGSKSKKKQAEQNYNASIQQATAGLQQQQANYLQNQKLTQAAISPYAAGYQPNGYQFKNALMGGAKSPLPQPQSGQLNIPNQPAQVIGNGIGKPLTANIPGATFTPGATQFQMPSTTIQPQQPTTLAMPQYSSNQTTNQNNANTYLQGYAQNIALQNQLNAATAMNPYAQFLGQ